MMGLITAGMSATVASGSAESTVANAPFGTWRSPISAGALAQASIAMSDLKVVGGAIYWRESRPTEGGRQVVMMLAPGDTPRMLTPPGFNVRSRVHEYGGASYLRAGDALAFVNFSDQKLYLQHGSDKPRALTPAQYQYADGIYDAPRNRLICVREDHTQRTVATNGEERNEIVALRLSAAATATEQAGEVLATGSDFVAAPRLSPDGLHLAWMSWSHPHMPWDEAHLNVAAVRDDGTLGKVEVVAGGRGQAVIEPAWDPDGTLYFINDPDGWWNLYRWRAGRVSAVASMQREFGGPLWTLGGASYALLGDGRALVRTSLKGIEELALIDLETGSYRALDLPFVAFGDVRRRDSRTVISIAASANSEPALIAIDIERGTFETLHQPVTHSLPADEISAAVSIEFETRPGQDGAQRFAQAFFYPPVNAHFRAADGERPPLLVMIHGGPTAVAKPVLSLARQFWTTRGFALVDVNYGGSTSFGRAYRERLNGGWGVVDVADAVAAVDHLIAQDRVDPRRIAIRGGSAGGYTTLAALAFTRRFNAGANYFGVSDIEALATSSHKFERQYDVSLIGPRDAALYRERSPIHHLAGFTEPLITIQGAEDKVVPPEQSRAVVAALDARGVPHAYLEFAGEQHGLRKAENIVRAQEAELYFYGRVFGFTPADRIEPVEIKHVEALGTN
jgi:dipeptidyl aminopeptidase/acylaminoacyl peptidase